MRRQKSLYLPDQINKLLFLKAAAFFLPIYIAVHICLHKQPQHITVIVLGISIHQNCPGGAFPKGQIFFCSPAAILDSAFFYPKSIDLEMGKHTYQTLGNGSRSHHARQKLLLTHLIACLKIRLQVLQYFFMIKDYNIHIFQTQDIRPLSFDQLQLEIHHRFIVLKFHLIFLALFIKAARHLFCNFSHHPIAFNQPQGHRLFLGNVFFVLINHPC